MNGKNQDRREEIMRAEQKRVFQHRFVGVHNACQQRKDIFKHDHVQNANRDDHREDQRPHNGHRAGGGLPQVIEDIAVRPEEQPHAQQDQPQHRGLLEVLPERAEKGGADVAVLVPHDLQRGVIQRRRRGADRHDRDRADEPQQIQIAGIAQLQQQLAEFAFVRKEFHSFSVPSSKFVDSR